MQVKEVRIVIRRLLENLNQQRIFKNVKLKVITYWTPPVAHPHIALDIERRGPSEPEGLHVRIHLRLVHSRIRPGAPEA